MNMKWGRGQGVANLSRLRARGPAMTTGGITSRYRRMTDINPLLADWTTAHGLPPFGEIRPEHFRPAFDAALAAHKAEIAAIAGDKAEPSFANTIEALERSGGLLERVSNVFFVLAGAHTSDAIQSVEREI